MDSGLPSPFAHCPACRAPTPRFEAGKALRCDACGFRYFHNVAAAVGVVIVVDAHLLLARRAEAPRAGTLDLPGGFVDPDETLEAAAVREIAEELALSIDAGDLRYLFSGNNRYRYADVDYATSDCWFGLRLAARPVLRHGSDVSEALWRTPEQALEEELSFPTVREGIERLRAMTLSRLLPAA